MAMTTSTTGRRHATASNAKRGIIEPSGRKSYAPSETVSGVKTPMNGQRMTLTRSVCVCDAQDVTIVLWITPPSAACRTVFGALRRVRRNVRKNSRIGNLCGVLLVHVGRPNALDMNMVTARGLARTTLAVIRTVVLLVAGGIHTVVRAFVFAPTQSRVSEDTAPAETFWGEEDVRL